MRRPTRSGLTGPRSLYRHKRRRFTLLLTEEAWQMLRASSRRIGVSRHDYVETLIRKDMEV